MILQISPQYQNLVSGAFDPFGMNASPEDGAISHVSKIFSLQLQHYF